MKIRLGVLGAYRGFAITNGCRNDDDFEVYAVCDKNRERLDAAMKTLAEEGKTSVLAFTDYAEMLASDIDAVLVATDAPLHVKHTLMALEAGKHVLSEIPTIYSLEEAKILKDAVNAHPELKYMTAENCCFWENIRSMKRMYEDGKLGTVVYAESEYLHCEKTPEEYKPYADPDYWRAHLSAIRYLTHNLGPLLYILDDEAETVSCYVPDFDQNKYKSEKGVGIALFKTKKGAVIRIFICFGAYVCFDHNFAIYGSNGMMLTDKTEKFFDKNCYARFADIPTRVDEMIEIPVGVDIKREKSGGHGGADPKMAADFLDCIINDTEPVLDVDYGIGISLPGIMAEESYKNGNIPVDIPEI